MTGRAADLAALAVLAARRAELFEAALAAADVAAARVPEMARPLTRFRARDTRREDAARARAVALAGLQRARWVEAAAAAELGRLLGGEGHVHARPGEAVPVCEGLGAASRGRAGEAAQR